MTSAEAARLRGLIAELGGRPMAPLPPMPRPWPRLPGRPAPQPRIVRDPSSGETMEVEDGA